LDRYRNALLRYYEDFTGTTLAESAAQSLTKKLKENEQAGYRTIYNWISEKHASNNTQKQTFEDFSNDIPDLIPVQQPVVATMHPLSPRAPRSPAAPSRREVELEAENAKLKNELNDKNAKIMLLEQKVKFTEQVKAEKEKGLQEQIAHLQVQLKEFWKTLHGKMETKV